MEKLQRLMIADLRSGRNGTDPPLSLKQPTQSYQGSAMAGSGECVEAINVDWYNASLARKRGGADSVSLTFTSGGPFTGKLSFLGRHVPTTDEAVAELWAVDDAATPVVGRMAGAATFTAPTLKDNLTGNGWDVTGASLNGKYFLSYKSAQARLHVWDPVAATVRRTGYPVPGAVTVADVGGGAYAAIARWYRVRWVHQTGGITDRRSEPGSITLFTPSGAGSAARITRPAAPGEGETHFEVEASLDSNTFYRIATEPIASAFYDDGGLTTLYSSFTLSDLSGTYLTQKSYKFLAVDSNRLLGFGSWTTTDKQNRVEFSALVGAFGDVGNDERVPLTNYIDLDENDSGAATGLVGPVFGAFYAFKYRQVWKLVPTGVATAPYSVFPLSKVVGAISHHGIKVAEDASGNPAIYFQSTRGPYRIGTRGLEYIGHPIEDLWLGPTKTVNLGATNVVSHAIYHSDKRQVWTWVATGSANDPDVKLVFDIEREAWSRHDGPSAAVRCSVMFANTLGATMSRDFKPYAGRTTGTVILKCDTATTNDAGTNFQSYIVTKPYALGGGLGGYFTVGQGTLVAQVSAGVTITQSLIRDFGLETRTATCLLTAQAAETRTQQLLDSGAMAGAGVVQLQIGDAAAVSNSWSLDVVTMQYRADQAIA